MSWIAFRKSRAPLVKNTRDPGWQSIPFDRRNASTINIICETVGDTAVYTFDSLFWIWTTVLFTISRFSLDGEPFFLPSAFCFFHSTSSMDIFALIAFGSSKVSCSSDRSICFSFSYPIFSSSIMWQTFSRAKRTASSFTDSNTFF